MKDQSPAPDAAALAPSDATGPACDFTAGGEELGRIGGEGCREALDHVGMRRSDRAKQFFVDFEEGLIADRISNDAIRAMP